MSLGLCLNNDQSIAFVVVIFQISNGNFHYYMKITIWYKGIQSWIKQLW